MLYNRAQDLKVTPSSIIGLTAGSYEAYCLDEAVWYAGITIHSKLEEAGIKKDSESLNIEAARKKVLADFLGPQKTGTTGFADPSALF